MISFCRGLFSTPAFASPGPAWATASLQHRDLGSRCPAAKAGVEKEVCILTRGDTELVTEGVRLVHGSGKKWGFEPWQCRKPCLRRGAPSCCGKPLRGDGAHAARMV